jgi:hypothetical protein
VDYLKHIDLIVSKLPEQGYSDFASRITQTQRGASSASELLLCVTHELLKAINDDTALSALIGTEVLQLEEFCWSIGLNVHR